jgi:hypothetical protein
MNFISDVFRFPDIWNRVNPVLKRMSLSENFFGLANLKLSLVNGNMLKRILYNKNIKELDVFEYYFPFQ